MSTFPISSTRRRVRAARRALRTLIAIATCAAALGALAPAASAASLLSPHEVVVVQHVNRYRATHGLPPLRIDLRLTRTAHWMGLDMATKHRFSHTDSLGRDPFRRLADFGYPTNTWRGENLAAGYFGAYATFLQWVNSPPHRANMLKREFRAIGVAKVCRVGSPYTCYWVHEFGSRWTSRVAYP